jgi:serine/threonine protein kinase
MVDEAETVKVIDFGSATVTSSTRRHACYVVSRFYRAPELLLGAEKYSEKIDIWSIGCIIWEIIMGTVLFPGADAADQILRIIAVLGSPTKSQFDAMKVKDRTAEYVSPKQEQSPERAPTRKFSHSADFQSLKRSISEQCSQEDYLVSLISSPRHSSTIQMLGHRLRNFCSIPSLPPIFLNSEIHNQLLCSRRNFHACHSWEGYKAFIASVQLSL